VELHCDGLLRGINGINNRIVFNGLAANSGSIRNVSRGRFDLSSRPKRHVHRVYCMASRGRRADIGANRNACRAIHYAGFGYIVYRSAALKRL
jgi:hypothetical protein